MPKTERWGKKFKDNIDWVEYNSKLIKRGEWFFDFALLENISYSNHMPKIKQYLKTKRFKYYLLTDYI